MGDQKLACIKGKRVEISIRNNSLCQSDLVLISGIVLCGSLFVEAAQGSGGVSVPGCV